MITIDVKSELDQMRRDLSAIRQAIPRITAQALNETATYARKATIDETARVLRLPRKVIATTTRGREKVERFRLYKANRDRLEATLQVISKGIQVTDVAGAWVGRRPGRGGGVKAKGGRFYQGAFKARAGRSGDIRVFKRQVRGGTRVGRTPLFLPRIGARKGMEAAFGRMVGGEAGRRIFAQRFNRLADFALKSRGFR
ncbi:MAG: phage tail protein [Gammaproteobacteria bacterium]|nr:phage tail protein [Gammaproteobacteria bacterium]